MIGEMMMGRIRRREEIVEKELLLDYSMEQVVVSMIQQRGFRIAESWTSNDKEKGRNYWEYTLYSDEPEEYNCIEVLAEDDHIHFTFTSWEAKFVHRETVTTKDGLYDIRNWLKALDSLNTNVRQNGYLK